MEALLGIIAGLLLYHLFNQDKGKGAPIRTIKAPDTYKPDTIIVQKKVEVKIDKEDLWLLGIITVGTVVSALVSPQRVPNDTSHQSSSADVTQDFDVCVSTAALMGSIIGYSLGRYKG